MSRPCSNALHVADATVEVLGRALCASCAWALRLNVAALRPSTPTADELVEHARAAFNVERRDP